LLEERGIEVGALYPLALADTDRTVDFGGDTLPVMCVDGFDWRQADILLAATRDTAARRHLESAVNQGCKTLTFLSGLDLAGEPPIRAESGISEALAKVLRPIADRAGLASVDVFASLPASLHGQAALDELVHQTRGLFAMEEVEPEIFPLRIAFNLIPQVGQVEEQGGTSLETAWQDGVQRLLDNPDLPVHITAAWVPTLYGVSLAIHGRTHHPLQRDELIGLLTKRDGVTVMDEAVPGGVPTPSTDAQDSEDVFVGRLRCWNDPNGSFAMWAVCDVLRLEAAKIMDLTENLIEKFSN